MTPQLRFSKDFDSFTVETDHLDVICGKKTFRLAYPINGERKFSVGALGNTKLFLPEMLLKCYNQDVPHGILVNVEAGFEDVLTLGRFVEKLPSVVGYQQVRVDEDNLSANTSCGLEYDEIDEEIDDANMDPNLLFLLIKKMNRDRPILMFENTTYTNRPLIFFFPGRGAGYFEITSSDTHYRFAYMAGVNRTYESGPKDFGRPRGRFTYLMHNVMLQSPPNPNDVPHVFELRRRVVVPPGPFVDLAEVDVFVDLGVDSNRDGNAGLKQDSFSSI